jgi:hypothetical protein
MPLMVASMKGNTQTISLKVMVLLLGVIKKSTLVNGGMECFMGREPKLVRMVLSTPGCGETDFLTGRVNVNMKIKAGMMDNGEMDNHMAKARSTI